MIATDIFRGKSNFDEKIGQDTSDGIDACYILFNNYRSMAFLRHISGENLGELVCTDTGREGLYNSKFGKLMQPVMMAITLSA